MNTSNVIIGDQAIGGMMAGVKVVTDAIKLNYGPEGLNTVVETEFPPFNHTANDAQTIIQAIQVTDPIQKIGLNYLKELSDKQNETSGDGRKTSLLIAASILEQGYSSELKGLKLKRELDNLIPLIEEKINESKKEITENEVESVATIAGESQTLGRLLGDVYKHIGKDGIIIPEGSGTYQTSYSFIDGIRFTGTGYLSPFLAHDDVAKKEGRKETKAIYENPTILVTKRKIQHINEINPLLETLQGQGKKDLIIFTDDMDSTVASLLIKAHQDHILNVLIIKAPVLFKQYVFEDFAKVVGATIVEDSTGITFKNLELKHLGTCGKITVDKDETTIVGGADISDHIADLKSINDTDSKLRLSWLTTKTCILKLGANNESELSYLRLKSYDAISSSRLALKDGVVKGGGVCLFDISKELPSTIAGKILCNALQAPLKQNLLNMGLSTPNWDESIVDASAVVKMAVRNAVSLASTVLTTGIVINLPPKSQEQLMQEAMKGNKLRF